MRIGNFMMALLLMLNLSLPIFSINTSEFPKQPQLYAQAAVLMNADTGQILYGKNANQQMYPASLTKIMTCLLAMERGNYDDIVTVRKEAIQGVSGTTHIALSEGEQLTMEQLLYAVMLESANDAASAVGIHLAGSVAMFSELMNQRAKALGAVGTHFVNANGLPDDNHYSTAYDLALITKEALKHPEFQKFAGTHQYKISPTNKMDQERTVTHHNYMFVLNNTYDGAFAGKTGWTQEAGKCLMTVAQRDDITLIAIVLKSSGAVDAEFEDSTALFDYGFDNFRKVSVPWTSFPSQQVSYLDEIGKEHQGRLYPAESVEDISVLLAKGVDETDLVPSTFLPQPLTKENLSRIRFEVKLPEVAGEVQDRIVATYQVEVRPLDIQADMDTSNAKKKPFPWSLVFKILLVLLVLLVIFLCAAFYVLWRLSRMYYRSFFNTRHWETSPESKDLFYLQHYAPTNLDWIEFRKQYAKQRRLFGLSLEDLFVLLEVHQKAKQRLAKPISSDKLQKRGDMEPSEEILWDLPKPADRPRVQRSASQKNSQSRPRRSNRPF